MVRKNGPVEGAGGRSKQETHEASFFLVRDKGDRWFFSGSRFKAGSSSQLFLSSCEIPPNDLLLNCDGEK